MLFIEFGVHDLPRAESKEGKHEKSTCMSYGTCVQPGIVFVRYSTKEIRHDVVEAGKAIAVCADRALRFTGGAAAVIE
ncbi:unannotated protein [freshwater metagenome]|uniref:Unannotated protein n=1 Tax=freshwater metagenome TaxID=449393 RepID=A0A6J7VJX0_9ZZZZ